MKKSVLLLMLASISAFADDRSLSFDLGEGTRLDLLLINKGSFTQGSPSSEPKRGPDENQREITLTRDFYMGKFPVTCAQFDAFATETHYRSEAEKGTSGGFGWDGSKLVQRKDFNWRNPGFEQTGDSPVTTIAYSDALAFCDWLSRKTRRAFALPTEAQWEYACRAGTTTAWHNGDDEIAAREIAWFKPWAENHTHLVDSLKPNAWGLYMGGNVAEWCRDWYGPYSSGASNDPEQTNPNLSDKPRRVLRGGSWAREVQNTRSAARFRNDPGSRNADNGFRVITYPIPATPPPAPKILPEAPDTAQTPSAIPPASPPPQRPVTRASPAPVTGTIPMGSAGAPVFKIFLGLLCPLLFFAFFVTVIVLIVKKIARVARRGPAAARRPRPLNVQTETAGDGFWVHTASWSPTAILYYEYWASGTKYRGEAPIQPGLDGRQFIYTALRPDQVIILQIAEAGANQPPDVDVPPFVDPNPGIWMAAANVSDSPDPSPPSFPTAY